MENKKQRSETMFTNIENKRFLTEMFNAVWEALDPQDKQYVKEVSKKDFKPYMLAVLPNIINAGTKDGFLLGNFILILDSDKAYDLFKEFVATK